MESLKEKEADCTSFAQKPLKRIFKISVFLEFFFKFCKSFCIFDRGKGFSKMYNLSYFAHPGLTRLRSIRFLLFEIKRVLVYNSTVL